MESANKLENFENLEDVSTSDTATEDGEGGNDHEEGEISDEDVAEERVVPKPVTSEVVIYDDHGRTAIFTSPVKDGRWSLPFYAVYKERRHSNRPDFVKKRKSEEMDTKTGHKKRKHVSKENKKRKSHQKRKFSQSERGDRHLRHRSVSNSSASDCSCSCSCSSSSSRSSSRSATVKEKRGKENINSSVLKQSIASKLTPGEFNFEDGHSASSLRSRLFQNESTLRYSSKKLENTQEQREYLGHTVKNSLVRKLSSTVERVKLSELSETCKDSVPGCSVKKSSIAPLSKKSKFDRYSSVSYKGKKSNFGKKVNVKRISSKTEAGKKKIETEVIDLTFCDQIAPRPGSLGEMLLKKTKKGKLKPGQTLKKNVASSTCEEVAEVNEKSLDSSLETDDAVVMLNDMVNLDLDQEDEDELQLRLIALQSSLKVLNDVCREGQNSVVETKFAVDSAKSCMSDNIRMSICLNDESKYDMSDSQNFSHSEKEVFHRAGTTEASPQYNTACSSRVKNTFDEEKILPFTCKRQSVCGMEDSVNELSDSNQDLVDMEICNSSPEEENEEFIDALQEVGEDIRIEDSILKVPRMEDCNPFTQDAHNQNKFQIPVEWAYMLPPPPPPNQPDNDISNIDNWCYDQNMYLQSMHTSSCSATDQVSGYDPMSHVPLNVSMRQNQPNVAVYGLDETIENDVDSEGKYLNHPRYLSSEIDEVRLEDGSINYSNYDALKDEPAHHYKAFMSAVMQQQNVRSQSHLSNSDRTLIEVNIVPSSPPSKPGRSFQGTDRNLIKVSLVNSLETNKPQNNNKSNIKAAARRRRRSRIKLAKLKAKQMLTSSNEGLISTPEAKSSHIPDTGDDNDDDDDEDLLRAQLLIDLSMKKMQKEQKMSNERKEISKSSKSSLSKSKTFPIGTSTLPFKLDKNIYKSSVHGEKCPPKYKPFISSPLRRTVVAQQHRRKEGSPTLLFKKDGTRLSDIGGCGLDPKSSRYDFTVPQDINVRKDFPKFKFPPVKPVIIEFESDSSEEESTEESSVQTSPSICEKPDATNSGHTSNSVRADTSFSSSLDLLLKTLRNNKPHDSSKEKPQFSSSSVHHAQEIKPDLDKKLLNSTPNIVRHLSRKQQVEYHFLKEELKRKEGLQRKRQLQQTQITNRCEDHDVAPSKMGSKKKEMRIDNRVKTVSTEDAFQCNTAVNVEEKREVHSHISSIVRKEATSDSCIVSEENERKNMSSIVEPKDIGDCNDDDDDEETLRMLVLQTLQKKPTNNENVKEQSEVKDIKSEIKPLSSISEADISKENNVLGAVSQFSNDNKTDTLQKQTENNCDLLSESCQDNRIISKPRHDASILESQAVTSPVNHEYDFSENVMKKQNLSVTSKNHDKSSSLASLPENALGPSKLVNCKLKRKQCVKQITDSVCSRNLFIEVNKCSVINEQKTGSLRAFDVTKHETAMSCDNSAPHCDNSYNSDCSSDNTHKEMTSSVRISEPSLPKRNQERTVLPNSKDVVVVECSNAVVSAKKTAIEEKQKNLDDLERIEREYSTKRLQMNEVIVQLDVLVQEATKEERQRQSVKLCMDKLRDQLTEMESQFEKQSLQLKLKMARIRQLQNLMISGRHGLKKLEEKGVMLGKQVIGADYVLRKVLDSPKSKSTETMRKKQLSDSISALRQQMHNVSNKSKAKLYAAAVSAEINSKAKNCYNVKDQGFASKKKLLDKSCNLYLAEGTSKAPEGTNTPVKVSSQGTVAQQAVHQQDCKEMALGNHKENSSRQSVPNQITNCLVIPKKTLTVEAKECKKSVLESSSESVNNHLDEMNELCPYDLLGRCNDDSCIYQHLRQPTVHAVSSVVRSSVVLHSNSSPHSLRLGEGKVSMCSPEDSSRDRNGEDGIIKVRKDEANTVGRVSEKVIRNGHTSLKNNVSCSDSHLNNSEEVCDWLMTSKSSSDNSRNDSFSEHSSCLNTVKVEKSSRSDGGSKLCSAEQIAVQSLSCAIDCDMPLKTDVSYSSRHVDSTFDDSRKEGKLGSFDGDSGKPLNIEQNDPEDVKHQRSSEFVCSDMQSSDPSMLEAQITKSNLHDEVKAEYFSFSEISTGNTEAIQQGDTVTDSQFNDSNQLKEAPFSTPSDAIIYLDAKDSANDALQENSRGEVMPDVDNLKQDLNSLSTPLEESDSRVDIDKEETIEALDINSMNDSINYNSDTKTRKKPAKRSILRRGRLKMALQHKLSREAVKSKGNTKVIGCHRISPKRNTTYRLRRGKKSRQ
ncbi:hypothetical protein SK128_020865 [Halocaridina rubra]|uniref:Ig-like domain-containing protein n=1 Tax=Halocaridina rubra TaxID=373956 RepID=A0AAN9A3U7_HALRR